jgi:hypothetical protein
MVFLSENGNITLSKYGPGRQAVCHLLFENGLILNYLRIIFVP